MRQLRGCGGHFSVGAITRHHRNEHGIPFRYPTLRHLLQIRPRLPCVPALLKLRLGHFQGRHAIRARHWTIDRQRLTILTFKVLSIVLGARRTLDVGSVLIDVVKGASVFLSKSNLKTSRAWLVTTTADALLCFVLHEEAHDISFLVVMPQISHRGKRHRLLTCHCVLGLHGLKP
jgi:hypothetical protein